MTNIEVHTSWSDSGYDCDHCGGRILQRTDRETGRPLKICFQCEACGCQWTPEGDVLRVGRAPHCRQAQRQRRAIQHQQTAVFPAWLWVVGGGLILLLIIWIGGLMALRFIIPVAIAALVATAVYRFGRERAWW